MADDMLADDGIGMRVAFQEPAFLAHLYGPPTLERLNFLFEHEQRWVGARDKFVALSIVDPRVGKEMNGAARQRAREISDHWGKRMVCSVTIVEGSGFFPALVRGVVTSIQLVSRVSKINITVATTVDEGVAIAARALRDANVPFDEAALGAALRSLPNRSAK